MVDPDKQISYWRASAEEDWGAAEDLVRLRRLRHGLFFAHLALEKVLKAHVCRVTRDLPPRIHQLLRLADRAKLLLSDEQRVLLARFDRHQLEGRYSDTLLGVEDPAATKEELREAREVFEWLNQQF
jgi:HEPN domain-containing protein